MFKDRASFITQFQRNRKAYFANEVFNGYITRIALNRAAKRFLLSGKIQKLALKNGAKIIKDEAYTYIF